MMDNKFTMELVWHNCLSYPPKEFENDNLIVTNGKYVFYLSWHRAEGYWITTKNTCQPLNFSELENWWWADIEQTVQGDIRFISKKEENNT